jgi:hypothetical protein
MRPLAFLSLLTAHAVISLATASALAQAPPELPKPGPEHELLKQLEGTWEASMTMPGSPAPIPGVMVYKMECGGLWLTSDYKSEFPQFAFHGKGLDGYDPGKKKYIGIWVDSMITVPMMIEGTYDATTKQLTMVGEAPGPSGKPEKVKTVSQFNDADHHSFRFYVLGADGEEKLSFSIDYTRRK